MCRSFFASFLDYFKKCHGGDPRRVGIHDTATYGMVLPFENTEERGYVESWYIVRIDYLLIPVINYYGFFRIKCTKED